MLKKSNIFVLVWGMILILSLLVLAGNGAGQVLIIDQPVYDFKTMPEGKDVSHDFILKNTGNTLIRITKVNPP